MNAITLSSDGGKTPLIMSSREIAELTRKRHDNVMRDARAILVELYGDRGALNFEGSYVGQDGTTRPCLLLPKRETLILVSGYSVELRARIIDRLEELEAERAVPRRSSPRLEVSREHRLTMNANLRLAKLAGLDGNQAVLSANRATAAMTGIDTLGLMGITHMKAPQNDVLLTPTEIGQRLGGISAQRVNQTLCDMGYQTRFPKLKGGSHYEPTDAGVSGGAVMQDTSKSHGDGTPIRQLKWASSVIPALEHWLAECGAA